MTDHTPVPKVSRLEVVSTGARRHWTFEEKQRIVAESYDGPRLASVTRGATGCLRANCSHGAGWRARVDWGGDAAPALVPVEITPVAAPISSGAPQPTSSPPAQRPRAGIIEIELGGGCRVRVDRDVDVETLQQVLELLRRR